MAAHIWCMKYILILLALISLPVHAQTVPSSAVQMQLSFAPLVKEATPAVVNIYARTIVQSSRTPLQSDPTRVAHGCKIRSGRG